MKTSDRMLSADEKSMVEAVGKIMRERFGKLEEELQRTDRAFILAREVEALQIQESLARLTHFVHAASYERSRLVEARAVSPPPWLAELDAERAP
jgi:hypothetical protein